ncbi:hypothetical protein HWV62_41248 [Athelia sp. TMB]|nr:hypothetical protein HWV62_41248 [Athelia sp. TMB]
MRNSQPRIVLPELPKFDDNASAGGSSGPSGTSPNSTTQKTSKSQKHRPDRACDACRRSEISRPRGPSKAYVNGLEDKVERLEAFLKTANVDFDSQLGPAIIRDSWKSDFANSSASGSRKTSPASTYPVASSSQHSGLSPNPANLIDLSSAISFHHRKHSGVTDGSFDTISDAEDGAPPLRLVHEIGLPSINHKDLAFQFTGESSNYHLAHHARQVKENYRVDAKHGSAGRNDGGDGTNDVDMHDGAGFPGRRAEFWSTPPWELCWEDAQDSSSHLLPELVAALPSPDLASDLIGLFFANINLQFPLLHRPTFQRNWDAGLQLQDAWFSCLCLLVFAAASRWSDDVRVFPIEDDETLEEDARKRKAGHNFFEPTLAIYQGSPSVSTPASLHELQSHAALALFLRGTSDMPLAWTRVGIALRKAQDLGIHRKRSYRIGAPTVEEEQWKRVFWVLVALDRVGSASLGRPCCVDETDFDLDLPIEVDDQFWEMGDSSASFQQPLGKPSLVTAFNYFLNLTQVMSFALRTLYSVNRSKDNLGGPQGPAWQEELVMQMNNAMTGWVDSVPEHLRWTPGMEDLVFSTQAATLYTSYYLVQILIYKPFIQRPLAGKAHRSRSNAVSNFPFPAATICVKAAESCARILDSQMKRGLGFVPSCIAVSHNCGAILAAEIWYLKCQERAYTAQFEDVKPPSSTIDALLADLAVFVKALRAVESTWEIAHIFLEQLEECIPGENIEPGLGQSLRAFDPIFMLPPPKATTEAFIAVHAPENEHDIVSAYNSTANIAQQQFPIHPEPANHIPYGLPISTPGTMDPNQWFWPTTE